MQPLSHFIRDHTEDILCEWEQFARSLQVGTEMDVVVLRDHAEQMLDVIADDLESPQSAERQISKSQGGTDAPTTDRREDMTAAQEHGAGRAESGFTVAQMVAEFRALRASVLRLWIADGGTAAEVNLEEVIRFNEAIDQAVAESISRYTEDLDRTRERFLAILGHDLINPLGAIMTSSRFMIDAGELEEPNRTLITRIDSSAVRMNRLIADLLDFTRTRFGDGIPIVRNDTDARRIIHDVVAETSASQPDRMIQTQLSGDLSGRWDRDRIAQVLSNLIGNAVSHGAADTPIRVSARGTPEEIEIAINNEGSIIANADINSLFHAMKAGRERRDRRHLGLGLYIVEKIVRAHQGTIAVDSTKERGTTFTVTLPRQPSGDDGSSATSIIAAGRSSGETGRG